MKFIKSNIKIFVAVVITMIVTASITGVVAYNYSAKDISYTSSDSNWNVNNVEDAINSLRDVNKQGFKLVAEGNDAFSSGETTPTKINVDVKDSNYISNNVGIITINKKGKYIVFIDSGPSGTGSDGRINQGMTSYNNLYVNNNKVGSTSGWAGIYDIKYYIFDLNKNDTIYAERYGNGENIPKSASIRVFKY